MTKILELPFLLKNDKVISLKKGHTTAKKWIVERDKKKYFLKETTSVIQRDVYEEINSSTEALPKLIDQSGVGDKIYTLYEFKEGKDFEELTTDEILKYATLTAKKLKQFSKIKTNLPTQDLQETIKKCKEEIDFYFEKREDNLIVSKKEFSLFVDKFSTSFDCQKTVLLHGDIKPENIIFDDDVCFVDTDQMRYGFFLFNFEYSVQMFFDKREKYKKFLWKMVEEYYDDILPEWFEDNLKFVCIKKFFNRAKMFISANDEVGEKEFIQEFKPIFEFLKQ